MDRLSPLRTKLVSLYGSYEVCKGTIPSMSPCRWEPSGWRYIKHSTPLKVRLEDVKTLQVTTPAINLPSTPAKLATSHIRHRRRVRAQNPPITAQYKKERLSLTSAGVTLPRGDFTDTVTFWAGRSVSPMAKTYNRKRNFITRWEDQALSKGTVRPF